MQQTQSISIKSIYQKDNILFVDVNSLEAGKDFDRYSNKEVFTLRRVLFMWLNKLKYYKDNPDQQIKLDINSIDDQIKKILDIFAKCYDIPFDGKCLSQEFIDELKKIPEGTFDAIDSSHRLKSAEGEVLYLLMSKYGIKDAFAKFEKTKIKKHPMCKKYKIEKDNDYAKNDYVKLIKYYVIDRWLAKMAYYKKNSAELEKFKTDGLNKYLTKALTVFNLRFGINCNENEITEKHLEIFKNIQCGNFENNPIYKIKEEDKSTALIYELTNKYGVAKALEIFEKELKKMSHLRKSLSSRGLSLFVDQYGGSQKAAQILEFAHKLLGYPYLWGGTTPSGFDCSGFVKYVFKSCGITIPRQANYQERYSKRVNRNELMPADLVFFNGYAPGQASHVGIYINDGYFIHCPHGENCVVISHLDEPYYVSHYRSAGRYL